jgi:hypothetical protein
VDATTVTTSTAHELVRVLVRLRDTEHEALRLADQLHRDTGDPRARTLALHVFDRDVLPADLVDEARDLAAALDREA